MSATLGLSCPDGGNFYICDRGLSRFIGCCTIDPCADGTGECPKEHLKTSSFSSDAYMNIPAQSCLAPYNNNTWYTCSAKPPFMGCCKNNPCRPEGCDQEDLLPARLSDIEADAQVFLSVAHGNEGNQGSGSHGLPSGAIIGIAVGGAVVVALIVGFITYRCGWFARRRREEKSTKTPNAEASKLYDATGDGGMGGLTALHSGTYPPRDWPNHERLRSDAGSPTPPYSAQSPGRAPYSPGDLYNNRYSDGPAEYQGYRDSRNRMSPVSSSSPFLSSGNVTPKYPLQQSFGNVAHYDPSYKTSPMHSRHPSEQMNMSAPPAALGIVGADQTVKGYHDSQYPAMELQGSEPQHARPISELPSQNFY